MLAYLSRYTHRVAIANSRLITFDKQGVTFKWKDYRIEGRDRYKHMTLATDEFIRRFLIHVLPKGFHRIRHYGLFAKSSCADNIAHARELLAVTKPDGQPTAATVDPNKPSCPCCGGRMIIIEVFRTRYNATASADRSTDLHQAGHLMTPSQSRKSARHARWLSTGQGRARSDITLWSQIVQQFTELHATRRSFISRFTVAQLAKSTRSQSTGSPAALKFP